MSRLVITVTHENSGQLNVAVQTDNADQQVALLQHQLAGAKTREETLTNELLDSKNVAPKQRRR